MEIRKINNDIDASECDKLLSKLVCEEKEFNENINESFVVNNYFKNLYCKEYNAIFVAIIDEKIVGYIYIKITTSEQGPELEHEAMIDGLYVEKEYRNNEVATKLVKIAREWAISKDVKYISLNVLNSNEAAKNLYYKEGFKEFASILKQKL